MKPLAFVLPALALLISATAHAQLTVNAVLSERRVVVGDIVTLEVTATAVSEGDIEIRVPPVEALSELRRSQSESTSVMWSGAGQEIRRERTLRIDYEAQKAATVSFPPITARAGGASASAPPVSLVIVAAGTQAQEAEAPTPGEVEPPEPEEGNLFLRYRSQRAQAYVGEQIVLDLEIFAAMNFSVEEAKPPPAPDGFWREILEQPTQLQGRLERLHGRDWRVFRMWRIALFPLESGEKVIAPTSMAFAINRSIFNAGQRLKRTAPPLKLEILPLPADGRPPDFAAANVGAYHLAAQIDRSSVKAGEAITLKLTLSGAGNIKNAKLPKVEAVDGFRVFPPTVRDTVSTAQAQVIGAKEAEILLMPTRGGRLEVPSFTLPIFDPAKRAYEVLRTDSMVVNVEGNVDPAAVAPQALAQEPEAAPAGKAMLSRSALRPLRYSSSLRSREAALEERPVFVGLLVAPPLLLALVMLGDSLRARVRRETPRSKQKKAARSARARLQAASEAANRGDAVKAYGEIAEVLLAFASERTGIALRGLTLAEAKAALLERGISADGAERLVRELEHSDFARFAPGGRDPAAVVEALDRTEALLSEIEGWEPKGGAR